MKPPIKTYYRASLVQDEDGSNNVWFDEWVVIHETKCFVFCVRPWCSLAEGTWHDSQRQPLETNMQLAKRLGIRVKQVHKENSRFAFASKELAFNRLKFIKQHHVMYLRQELHRVEQFLKQSQGKGYAEYQNDRMNELIPVIFVPPMPWENGNETTD